jgi:N4-gp56 family major capsid protein
VADQTIASANQVQNWTDEEWLEWARGTPFKRLMGSGPNAPIQVGESRLGKKKGGVVVTKSLVYRASNDPVMDDNTLRGNEENLSNYAVSLTGRQYRNAFIIGDYELKKANFNMLEAMRDRARVWNMELTRDLIIARLISPVTDGLTTYDAATPTQRNAWSVAQNPSVSNQRLLYGAAKGNWSGVHATDLGNIDGTADDMHQSIVRLARRLAQSCNPHISPAVSTTGSAAGREVFYMPMASLQFRDLESNMETTFQNADTRGDENHIFANGDIRVGNVVCFEVPEMDRASSAGGTLLTDVGASGTTEVEISVLMGAQAIMYELFERMHPISDDYDYDNLTGVGVAETLAVQKTNFNGYDHGCVTVYTSAVGD